MERKIVLIGVRKISSKKNQKDYYMIDYIDEKIPRTDYVTIEEYNRIASKQKTFLQECTAVFVIDGYRNVKISDIK